MRRLTLSLVAPGGSGGATPFFAVARVGEIGTGGGAGGPCVVAAARYAGWRVFMVAFILLMTTVAVGCEPRPDSSPSRRREEGASRASRRRGDVSTVDSFIAAGFSVDAETWIAGLGTAAGEAGRAGEDIASSPTSSASVCPLDAMVGAKLSSTVEHLESTVAERRCWSVELQGPFCSCTFDARFSFIQPRTASLLRFCCLCGPENLF